MIKIYTIPTCDACDDAKEWLKSKEVEYQEIDMSIGGKKSLIEKKKQFKSMGLKTYPVFIVDINGEEMIFPGFDKDSLSGVIKDIYGR